MNLFSVRNSTAAVVFCALLFGKIAAAQTPNQPGQLDAAKEPKKEEAEVELKQEEHQRILGVMPNFNTSNIKNAVPLTPKEKFTLAFKSATDPFVFLVAGIDSGIDQAENEYPGYGQGGIGYAKRFGASYADSFDGTLIGNALFPALLHQDPRYFRMGVGSFRKRFLYSISTTVMAKGDNGKWQPNYSNILGNFAAGGISNLYYPASDRGAGLTVERALTVSAEGALGALLVEFWPDISRRIHKKKI